MKRLLFAGALVLALLAPGARVQAQAPPNQTVKCTTDPIIFGQQAAFTLQGVATGWMLASSTWEFQWSVNGCTPNFGACDAYPTFNLAYPGTLTVRCTLNYFNPMGQTAKLQPSVTITVPPPDGIRIVSGDNVSTPFGQANPTVFQVTCKGQDSIYFSSFAQEKITKFKYLTGGKTLPDFSWVPTSPNGSGSAAFYCRGGKIQDMK